MTGWMHECTDGWMDGFMDGLVCGCMHGWMDGWRGDHGRPRRRETARDRGGLGPRTWDLVPHSLGLEGRPRETAAKGDRGRQFRVLPRTQKKRYDPWPGR